MQRALRRNERAWRRDLWGLETARTKVLSHKKGLNVWEPDTEPAEGALKEQVKISHGWVREQGGARGYGDSACLNKAHATYSKWMRDMELMWLCVCTCRWGVRVHVVEARDQPWALLLRHCFLRQVFYGRSPILPGCLVSLLQGSPFLVLPSTQITNAYATPAFLHGSWGLVLTLAQGALCQLLSPCGWFQVMNWRNKIG